uniref:Uncharacterized protein n=2 Tax=Clytia hemisphaerica TaxID=252671 RepID=A0A7M6DRS6_9CNID
STYYSKHYPVYFISKSEPLFLLIFGDRAYLEMTAFVRLVCFLVAMSCACFGEMERLRQLDQHYRIMMRTSDRFSTPFKRITRLFHTLVHKKVRTHVRINDKVIDANGMDKSKDAYLVIESDSFGTIKIHSMQEPIYYLCIGKDGKPIGIPKVQLHAQLYDVNNCIFKEQFTHKHVLFKSTKFYNKKTNTGCLAFKKNGKGRRVTRSKCGHRSTLFLERKSRIIIDIHNDGPLKSRLISLLRKDRKKS